MSLSWDKIPPEFLLPAIRLLPPEDVSRVAAVSKRWRGVAVDDRIWKRHCRDVFIWNGENPKVFSSFFEEFSYFKNRVPRSVKTVVDNYGYPLKHVVFSPDGKFMAVTGLPAYICIYDSDSLELLDERCMQEALTWSSIEAVQFSPDSKKILLSGCRSNYSGEIGGELVVYEISDSSEVHFLCRTPCSPSSFLSCWFDSGHLLVGELYPLREGFLNRSEPIRWSMCAATASPRFRRVVQLSQQARQENKTLSQKLSELELSGAVHMEGDLTELRDVLDKEQQCFRCYLKHQLPSEEYGTALPLECNCICHQIINRLLIFVIGDPADEKIAFKLIGNDILSDAFNMKRFQVEQKEEEDADPWQFVVRRMDEFDHIIPMGGVISSIKMSADQRQLVVTVNNLGDSGIRMKSIDLDKMIIDPLGIHWLGDVSGNSATDVGNSIIVGARSEVLSVWSRHHLGLPIGTFDAQATAIAIHPIDERVVTINGMELYIWE